ncbi:hypothetical protein [Rasiella sp. SM2506]|uniref:hypothetical protein n=1 Tax=Rasiella sp. SM2506 TaxID=3423914 RepID=UPI003D7A4C06
MKKILIAGFTILTLAVTFTSCRDTEEKTQKEQLIDNAQDDGAKIEVKDGGDKVKIENPDGSETKIKTDDDGDVKIKTDDNS